MDISNALKTFAYNRLSRLVVSSSAPSAINIRNEFRTHLKEAIGCSGNVAAELADDNFTLVVDRVENYLSSWDKQGIPRPLARSDQDHVFLAWPHERFLSYSGLTECIDSNFCELFDYVGALDSRRFLLICALWLKASGFQKIRICDSKGDEGVDLLGVQKDAGLRSIAFVVQAKTSTKTITRGTVLGEFGKYQMLPHTEKFLAYRRALDIDRHQDGVGWIYTIMANHTFNWNAKQVAAKLGVLLRSIHQIVFLLARSFDATHIADEVNRLEKGLKSDLELDYSTLFEI